MNDQTWFNQIVLLAVASEASRDDIDGQSLGYLLADLAAVLIAGSGAALGDREGAIATLVERIEDVGLHQATFNLPEPVADLMCAARPKTDEH